MIDTTTSNTDYMKIPVKDEETIQQLRLTINSQAEVIAELESVRVNAVQGLKDMQRCLDDLKQSLKEIREVTGYPSHEQSVNAKFLDNWTGDT